LTLTDLEFLVKSNISAFLQIGTSSIELIKAINSKNKFYLCLLSKDQLFNSIIDEFNSHIKAKKVFKMADIYKNFAQTNREIQVLDINSLTEKERKVSQLLTQGLSYKEIAQLMGVTIFAINQNTKRIYKKLSVRSRSELSYRLLN
jgi:DNA-binding NarL/FixJ family response regulator